MTVDPDVGSPKVSVVIVSWNGWHDLEPCLDSLRAQTVDPNTLEIHVIDNGSTDGTLDHVPARFPEVDLHENGENLGHCKGVNQGLRIARAPYVLILDSDTELEREAVSTLVDFMDANPDVALCAPRILCPDGSVEQTARNLPSVANAVFGRRSLLTRWFPGNPFSRRYLPPEVSSEGAATAHRVEQVSAACMLLRREVLARTGLWDEGFAGYWVDTDYCWRLKEAGLPVFCVTSARIVHKEQNRRGSKKSPHRIRLFHQGAFRLYRKHYTRGWGDPRTWLAWLALWGRAGLLIAHHSLIVPLWNRTRRDATP